MDAPSARHDAPRAGVWKRVWIAPCSVSGAVAFLLPLAVVLLDAVCRPNTSDVQSANTYLVTFVLACLSVALVLGAWMGHAHGSASRSELVVKGSLMVVITGVVG